MVKNLTSSVITLTTVITILTASCKGIQPAANFGKTAFGDKAMVVTAHPEATRVGVDVLADGGNAVDAMVAVHFALAVVYPSAGNIGGGGFMLLRDTSGETFSLDFREKAPMSAHRDMYLDNVGEVIPGLSLDGQKAAGVPGSVDGMLKAHEKFGSLSLKRLINPAIQLARKGFEVTEQQAGNYNSLRTTFIDRNKDALHIPLVKKHAWQKGDVLKQKDLAKTLKRIRKHGWEGFYLGETARLIVEEMKRGNGIITEGDLRSYSSVWRKPVTGEYKGYEVISMGPPSSGGIALIQLLGMSEHFDLAGSGHRSAPTIHWMTEMERRVYADRAVHLGDPDYWEVPQEKMLDRQYLAGRAAEIEEMKATPSEDVHAMEGEELNESEQTTHYSIVDPQGTAVSVTTTINSGYGSKVFVSGAGFLLNNEMDDFSSKPGVPNLYGLLGGDANAIEPQKRMLSAMTPTIVEKNNKLFMVVGTPGGSTIITSVYQTILNVIAHDMTMTEAVSARRLHHQWQPDLIDMEPGALDQAVQHALESMGHQLRKRGSIGRVDAILLRSDGTYEGAADPRGDDWAGGF